MRLTATWLSSRQEPRNRPSERQDINVDGREGLVVRLSPSGAVSFRFRYQRAGKRRWMVLGEFGPGGLSLANAFDQHHQAQRELEHGLDPIEERAKRAEAAVKAREERASAGTVADVVEQFVHRKLRAERWDGATAGWVRDAKMRTRPRKRPEAAEALLMHNLVEARLDGQVIGKLKARDLSRRQLVRLLQAIVDRPAPITANRVHALLVQMFNWAAAQDDIPASPMAGIERPGGDEIPRNRVLTPEEIRTVWAKLDGAEMAEPTRIALKLLLVTAQRRGELTFARWSHFDFDEKRWTIPVELLKSAHSRRETPQPHVVPLSPLALDLLGKLKAITGKGIYVLPHRLNSGRDRAYSERVLSRAVRMNAGHFSIPHWTPHDLRRTAASFMTKIGIPRLHVEKVLNHSTGDIAEVYDRHDYLPEKRVALAKWAAHLEKIIADEGTKVIPLQRAGLNSDAVAPVAQTHDIAQSAEREYRALLADERGRPDLRRLRAKLKALPKLTHKPAPIVAAGLDALLADSTPTGRLAIRLLDYALAMLTATPSERAQRPLTTDEWRELLNQPRSIPRVPISCAVPSGGKPQADAQADNPRNLREIQRVLVSGSSPRRSLALLREAAGAVRVPRLGRTNNSQRILALQLAIISARRGLSVTEYVSLLDHVLGHADRARARHTGTEKLASWALRALGICGN